MASEVGIVNRALRLLGHKPITNLDEGTKASDLAKALYFDTRDAVLTLHPWKFALGRAQLGALATGPVWGYARAFQWPADCLHVVEVDGQASEAWDVEGRSIVTNLDPPLNIRYIRRVTDPNVFDPLFIMVLAAQLAAEMAEDLTGSGTKQERMLKLVEGGLQLARTRSGAQSTPRVLEHGGALVDVRR